MLERAGYVLYRALVCTVFQFQPGAVYQIKIESHTTGLSLIVNINYYHYYR